MSENTSLSLYHSWHEATLGRDEDSVSHNLEALGYGTEVVVRLTSTCIVPGPNPMDGTRTVERYEIGGLQLAELIRAHGTKLSDTSTDQR